MAIRTIPTSALSRRTVLKAVCALGATTGTASAQGGTMTEATPEDTTSPIADAGMPDWRFSLVEIQASYQGTISRPDEIPDGITVVACQVIITNDSDQPMEFAVRDIRLRDSEGIEYQAGEYTGEEPRVVSQNLPEGERTRGWVWYGIPEAHQAASIVFLPPRPVLKITF